MLITVYQSSTRGESTNPHYKNKVEVTDEASLKRAVMFDHVFAKYKGNRRSKENFIESNCIAMDVDNDHSDDPKDWVTPEDIETAFPDVEFAIVYSRNNMKEKNGKAARPKFHVLFPVEQIEDRKEYENRKKTLSNIFQFFDNNALDAARFFFGTENPQVEIHSGNLTISEFLPLYFSTDVEVTSSDNDGKSLFDAGTPIPEGKRNSTMSIVAIKLLKRYGDTDETYQKYLKAASHCAMPLSEIELNTIWNSAKRLYDIIKRLPGYIPPEKYNSDFALAPYDFTDVGQSMVLANKYKGVLCYTPGTKFMFYNGSYWEESETKAVFIAQMLTTKQMGEAEDEIRDAKKEMQTNGAQALIDKHGEHEAQKLFSKEQARSWQKLQDAQAYQKFVLQMRNSSRIKASIEQAAPMVEIDKKMLDADPFLLNTPSGTYDLHGGSSSKKEHTYRDYLTKQTAVDPSDEGDEIWLKALQIIYCNDEELIRYVQEVVGLASIGKVYQEAMIIAYGEGSNGKSTFWNTILHVLGTYGGKISADTLTVGNRRNVKPELAEIRGKRILIASELEEGTRLNTATVKHVCSTDDILAEKKYKSPFSFLPTHTLVLYTNHLPKVGANDDGTWRRLIVVPYNAKIEGASDIKNYADYLVQHAGGAVLRWIMEGAKRVIENNFKIEIPEAVRKATEKYREENDWLAHFLDDCCEIGVSYSEKSGNLYTAYRNYCNRIGEYSRSTADFYKALDGVAGIERRRKSSGSMVLGLRIKSEFLEDNEAGMI